MIGGPSITAPFLPVSSASRAAVVMKSVAVLGDAVAQADRPEHVGQRVAGRDAGRLQAHRLAQVDLLLGERLIVHLVPQPGLARDQVEHLLPRGLLDVHGDGPVEDLVDPGPDVRVRLGRQGLGLVLFLVLLLLRVRLGLSRRPPPPARCPSSFSSSRPPSPWPPSLHVPSGAAAGSSSSQPTRYAAVRRRDDGDVQQPVPGQVLQRVFVGTAADLDRDRHRQLGVVGEEPLGPRLVLEVQGRLDPPELLEPVGFREVAERDAGREGLGQVRLEPLEPAGALGARRPVGEDRPLLHAEVDVDVAARLAEELHDRDRRDRELAGQLLVFELRAGSCRRRRASRSCRCATR